MSNSSTKSRISRDFGLLYDRDSPDGMRYRFFPSPQQTEIENALANSTQRLVYVGLSSRRVRTTHPVGPDRRPTRRHHRAREVRGFCECLEVANDYISSSYDIPHTLWMGSAGKDSDKLRLNRLRRSRFQCAQIPRMTLGESSSESERYHRVCKVRGWGQD